ncbi:MAG TPA: 30S ribosomal protein S12 methylthiotransferase RimO [Acidisarcina sp.]
MSPAKVAARQKITVGFVSLGCPKNLVDSEVMMGVLNHAGAEITSRPEDADILVVNTCAFIESAKQESVDTILEMAQHKIGGRARKLIVAGCLVERYRTEIMKNIPEVDAVVGTDELEKILAAAGIEPSPQAVGLQQPSPFTILTEMSVVAAPSLNQSSHAIGGPAARDMISAERPPYAAKKTTARAEGDLRETQGRFARGDWEGAVAEIPHYLYNETTPRLRSTPSSSAYIKIAEGCDHPCTFCVIPNIRGKFRSRRFESVIAEAENLVAQGVSEITLIGQDTTCYGEDFAMKDGLAQLLDRLAQVEGVRWLRFLYAYPNKITTALLETMARHDNICKYLDVPLQHASANVLKRMKRGASAEIFLRMIEKARATVPGLALRTSFVVGFPGETEADFQELCGFVEAAGFDWMGVFGYSDEEGAGAFSLSEKVPARTIESRRKRLMRLQSSISLRAKQQWVGRTFDLLVEGESKETPLLWEGRTQFHAPQIDGTVYINDFGAHKQLEPNRFYRCEITDAHPYDVVGRIVDR